MAELPDDAMIFGFSFIDEFSEIDMKEIHENLLDRGVLPDRVIFSTWDDFESDCTWVVACDRYLEEQEVSDVISFVIENNIEEEYCLINFVGR